MLNGSFSARRLVGLLVLTAVAVGITYFRQSTEDVALLKSGDDQPQKAYLLGVRLSQYDRKGLLSNRTEADSLTLYPNRPSVLLNPVFIGYRQLQPNWQVKSEQGLLYANDRLRLKPNVAAELYRIEGSTAIDFFTDELVFSRSDKQLNAPGLVHFRSNGLVAKSRGMSIDLASPHEVHLKSDVNVVYATH